MPVAVVFTYFGGFWGGELSQLQPASCCQVGGYTTVLRNTTLICDSAVEPNCTQTRSQRDCFVQLMADMPRGTTAPVVLQSTSSPYDDGSDVSAAVTSGGDGGSGHGVGVVAGIIGGAVGGAGGLLLAIVLAVFLHRRRKLRCSGLPGCFDLQTDSCKLDDLEQAKRCGGGGGVDGSKAHRADEDKSSRSRLIGDGKVRSSSQPSSTESNTITAASTPAAAAAAGSGPPAGAGAGVGVEGLLEQQRQLNAPTDVRLSILLGAGSFGRVYSGVWRSQPCAVKILTHGPHETAIIERELQVSLACRHPHVVETMHYVRLDVTGAAARLQQAKGGGRPTGGTASSSRSGDDLFPTPGRAAGAAGSRDVYETWLVQELCDGGALSSALYGGRPLGAAPPAGDYTGSDGAGRAVGAGRGRPQADMDAILSLALDISRGMAYLQGKGIVHGDLKAENVLLLTRAGLDARASSTETKPEGGTRAAAALPQAAAAEAGGDEGAPGGAARSAGSDGGGRYCRYLAKVADFGLSRALDPGRTHQTTRNVGTITHMPPESLMGGQMRLATDVYAFGMIMWELYTGCRPYSGLTAGEVVHRVVAQGSRPAFPRATPPAWQQLATECWAQEPEQRPTFEQVEQRLLALLPESSRPAAAVDAVRAAPARAPGHVGN